MTREEKLQAIADSVEMEPGDITEDTVLSELENWDSVAVLSIIAVINEQFNRFPGSDEILSYRTVNDLMAAME
jgi:acyl carrier protein